MTKPHLKLGGLNGSAFRLLTRAKNAMRDAGWDMHDIWLFDLLAGGDTIRATPTVLTPKRVYTKCYDEVAKRCAIASSPKAA